MGKAGLAVVVLGTAACSDGSTTATTSGAASTTTFGAGTSTTGVTPSTSSTSAEPPTQADGGFNWHRTNLDFVSAYVLYRGGEAVLVDTGVGGSADSIEASLGEIGLTWDAVGGVILTHSHPDHQGSIGSVLDRASEPPWYAGAGDLSAISAVGGSAVGDGESIFDLEIIETPGHTPGHILSPRPSRRDSSRWGLDERRRGRRHRGQPKVHLRHRGSQRIDRQDGRL